MAHGENAPLNITPGAIRFNTDSMKLEYFRIGMEGGDTSSYAGIGTLAAGEWVQITTDSPDVQTGGTRGLMGGGYTSANTDAINYITIPTAGNAIDFGNLTESRRDLGALASRTRGVFGLGFASAKSNVLDFVTISSTGNAQDFGDATNAERGRNAGAGNATRGLFRDSANSEIDYITIASIGNAIDFGDITIGGTSAGNVQSSTRAVWGGGDDTIEFVTISTLGDAVDFGNLTSSRSYVAGCSNSVRGVWGGGREPTIVNTMDYITIATLGNAVDFGDISSSVKNQSCGASSSTRGCWMAGENPENTAINTIDYFRIMTTGDTLDFGDTLAATRVNAGCSNGHGGLG